MVQSLYKNWLVVSKITWGIWKTSDKQWKVQNAEIWWVTFVQKIRLSKKYIPSAKRLYTEDLTLLSTTCLEIQITYVIFETKSHFSRHNSFVFFQFKSHILWTKMAYRCEIFGLLIGWVKIHQIPHVVFATASQFFFKLCITFPCHET